MRKIAVLLASVMFFLPFSFVFASADYDGESAYLMESSSGSGMVSPSSLSSGGGDSEISIQSVMALQSAANEYFENWGVVPDQEIFESGVFLGKAQYFNSLSITEVAGTNTYTKDTTVLKTFSDALVTVGATPGNADVYISKTDNGALEVRYSADFAKEVENTAAESRTQAKQMCADAVTEAISGLEDGKGGFNIEEQGEEFNGKSLSTDFMPDKDDNQLVLTCANNQVANEVYTYSGEWAEAKDAGIVSANPYESLNYSANTKGLNIQYADLSGGKVLGNYAPVSYDSVSNTFTIDPFWSAYTKAEGEYFNADFTEWNTPLYDSFMYPALAQTEVGPYLSFDNVVVNEEAGE